MHTFVGHCKDFGFCCEWGGPYWRVLSRERTGLTLHFTESHLCNWWVWNKRNVSELKQRDQIRGCCHSPDKRWWWLEPKFNFGIIIKVINGVIMKLSYILEQIDDGKSEKEELRMTPRFLPRRIARKNLPLTEMWKSVEGELFCSGKERRISSSINIWNLLNLRHLSDFQVERSS